MIRMKWFLTMVLVLVSLTVKATQTFTLWVPFSSDDLEDVPTNLVVSANSTNVALLSGLTVTNPVSGQYLLSVKTISNTFGNAWITLRTSDQGTLAERTEWLIADVGAPKTNSYLQSALTPTVRVLTNAVELSWKSPGELSVFPYKVLRSSTNSLDSLTTLVWTYNTNYTDFFATNASRYYYLISFTPASLTNYFSSVNSNQYAFEFRIRPTIDLRPAPPFGLYFVARSNAVYQIYALSNSFWNLQWELAAVVNQTILIPNAQNVPIYVREKE